ncbi:MAG: EAL domain-containing protein [Treponema sp.]|nr:EAL domain-containing protein [Candidatus Treponema equifaecale]
MKILIFGLMVLVAFVLGGCIRKLLKSSISSSRLLCRVLVCSLVSVVSSIIVYYTASPKIALISYGVYFSSLDWGLLSLLHFCRAFTSRKKHYSGLKAAAVCLCAISSISFFVNIFTQHAFSVFNTNFHYGVSFYYMKHSFYYFHLVLDTVFILHCIYIISLAMIKAPSVYKRKYINILVLICLELGLSILYYVFKLPFDLSVLFYALLGISFYYGSAHIIPDLLLKKTLNLLVDRMNDGLILFDIEGTCVYVNSHLTESFNATRKNIFTVEPFNQLLSHAIPSTGATYSENFDYDLGEGKRNFKLFYSPLKDEKGRLIGSYYTIYNITAENGKMLQEHLRATRDKLTGLYNRDYFCEKVEARLKFDKFTPYYLIVSDILNFKLVNDLFGTEFGDKVLQRIAEEIRNLVHDGDIYGRIHNDHFALLMPQRRYSPEIFLNAFEKTFRYLNNFAYSLVCHVGIYDLEERDLPASVMCDRASLALQSIKTDFKHSVAFYDKKLRAEVLHMQELMNELPLALKYGELMMYLQPQITKDEKVLGAEALVRWHHHEKGIIPPADFIQVIEKIGMISDVDMFVWEAACRKLAEWKIHGRTDMYISVNISPKDFYLVDVYETLTNFVKLYDISPKNLNLEITESAIIMDLDRQIKIIQNLRNFGFTVEMDDFGSGYSSLNTLKDIDVDVLKIDMAFLKQSENDEKSHKILEKIVMLAKDLGMKVVTEGVENRSQIDMLAEFGCDLFQGYYFSKPITVAEFEEKYFS